MATSAAKKLSVLLLCYPPCLSQRECETFAVWRRDWRVFIFITSSCASDPVVRGFPCGKRVRWLGWSRLTDLARPHILKSVKLRQANFKNFRARQREIPKPRRPKRNARTRLNRGSVWPNIYQSSSYSFGPLNRPMLTIDRKDCLRLVLQARNSSA